MDELLMIVSDDKTQPVALIMQGGRWKVYRVSMLRSEDGELAKSLYRRCWKAEIPMQAQPA